MITIERVSPQIMEQEAQNNGVDLPIEQTAVWADFQSGIQGRTPWGSLLIRDNNELVAVISLIRMETHGYRYLRSVHGPAWKTKPTQTQEKNMVAALAQFVKQNEHGIVFMRIDLWYTDGTYPVLSTVPYNETVVLDLAGGDDEILNRMKKRGRRDVRKSLRESPAQIADETQQATQNFSDYYAVMVETAQRDGFSPAPMSDYTDMLTSLGPDHCRVFAARVDGKVVAWAMVTTHGTTGVYYYASMLTEVKKLQVPDKLLYSIACTLGQEGYTKLDLMGIGNDFAPSLKTLNAFKTKFAQDTVQIAAARDIPLRPLFYRALRLMQDIRHRLRKPHKSNTK